MFESIRDSTPPRPPRGPRLRPGMVGVLARRPGRRLQPAAPSRRPLFEPQRPPGAAGPSVAQLLVPHAPISARSGSEFRNPNCPGGVAGSCEQPWPCGPQILPRPRPPTIYFTDGTHGQITLLPVELGWLTGLGRISVPRGPLAGTHGDDTTRQANNISAARCTLFFHAASFDTHHVHTWFMFTYHRKSVGAEMRCHANIGTSS